MFTKRGASSQRPKQKKKSKQRHYLPCIMTPIHEREQRTTRRRQYTADEGVCLTSACLRSNVLHIFCLCLGNEVYPQGRLLSELRRGRRPNPVLPTSAGIVTIPPTSGLEGGRKSQMVVVGSWRGQNSKSTTTSNKSCMISS